MKPNKQELPIDVISNLEQFDGMMANTAPIVATYYKSLILNGVPDSLASQLVIEWHNIFWLSNFPGAKGKK